MSRKQRVLVIDDDESFLEIARYHLEREGLQAETVANSREGLNRAIEEISDLIILDLMMPGMAGEEVLKLLGPFGSRQPILIVSSQREADFGPRTRDLGASGYLEKPIDPETFRRRVLELLPASGQESVDGFLSDLPPSPILDRLVLWVFDASAISSQRRVVAPAIVVGLLAVGCWIAFG